MKDGKTSTFTIHHDRCKPETWTAGDILKFAEFVRTGNLQAAACLSRLGVQLVLSEHHAPKGGELQEIGFMTPECDDLINEDLGELIPDPDDISQVVRMYRGPVEYAIAIPMGDGEGNFECYEYELKATEEEAQAYLKSVHQDMDEQAIEQARADKAGKLP